MTLALKGIRVIELVRVAPGALCTMMLGDLGAEVIKVEMPSDPSGGGPSGSAISPDKSRRGEAAFNPNNRNKKSITLDLKSPDGKEVFLKLVKTADVLVECFRPGVTKRLGLDYESLREVNPRLVYCSLSGFGQTGPYAQLPGHDINYLAIAGTLSLLGAPGQIPMPPLNLVGDTAGAALPGAIGILAALMARHQTGRGQMVDISFMDGVFAITAVVPGIWNYFLDGTVPKRGHNRFGMGYAYYNCYETKEGGMITVAAEEPHFWVRFCKVIGRDDLAHLLPRHEDHFQAPSEEMLRAVAEIRRIMKTKTRDEWFELMREADVTAAKVNSFEEAVQDPQLVHRNMVIEIQDKEHGAVKQVGFGIKLSDTPASVRSLSPYLGQHTDEMLRELGYMPEQIDALRSKRVIG